MGVGVYLAGHNPFAGGVYEVVAVVGVKLRGDALYQAVLDADVGYALKVVGGVKHVAAG